MTSQPQPFYARPLGGWVVVDSRKAETLGNVGIDDWFAVGQAARVEAERRNREASLENEAGLEHGR